MIDAFKEAGVAPEDVYAQSFNLDDILYWVKNDPTSRTRSISTTATRPSKASTR